MAAITASNVVYSQIKLLVDAGGQQIETMMDVAITLSSQGGTAADIPAAVFGLKRIRQVVGGVLNASGTITYVPGGTDSYTNTPATSVSSGYYGGGEVIPFPSASSGSRGNITGVWYVRIFGII